MSSNGNIFCVTGHLFGEFTGHRWIPQTKGQWCRALIFSLICVWINSWVNNDEAGDLRRHSAHYDVTVMQVMLKMPILDVSLKISNLIFQPPLPGANKLIRCHVGLFFLCSLTLGKFALNFKSVIFKHIIYSLCFWWVAQRHMSCDFMDDKLTLFQIMTCCHDATSRHLC